MYSPAFPVADPLALAWRLPPGLTLALRTVGDRLAVFNEESEDTHLLHPVAGRLVERLLDGEEFRGPVLAEACEVLRAHGFDGAKVFRELHVLGLAEPFDG